jgi:hypothetical protein
LTLNLFFPVPLTLSPIESKGQAENLQ